MRIARVMARSDHAPAERMLVRGIDLARELDNDTGSLILGNAVYLAAAVSPQHALRLYAERRQKEPFGRAVVGLVNAMAQHGHAKEAVAYLNNPLPGDRFPLDFVNNLARECHDNTTRLGLLRGAARAWKERGSSGGTYYEESFADRAFNALFGRYWGLLPEEEARPVLRELLQWSLDVKCEPRRFPLTEDPADPELASENELMAFELIPALQALEPELARSVFRDHPQLATAAKRFPLGMVSVHEKSSKFDRARDDSMLVGNSAVIPMPKALANDFEDGFREAYKAYAKDSDPENPNKAPKECWPSTDEFRNILFKAGQHQGLAAAKHLDRISDPDLRLFAQIELCAGAEDLPQIGGITARRFSKGQREYSPAKFDELLGRAIPGVRCPKCHWTPRANNLWLCNCGHQWNTFDTRGLCPECHYQWEVTGCCQCGEMSPHETWYVQQ